MKGFFFILLLGFFLFVCLFVCLFNPMAFLDSS